MGNTNGVSLPFDLGQEVQAGATWVMFEGSKRGTDKQPFSVFVHDKAANPSRTAQALNAMNRLRATRHPNVLRFVVRSGWGTALAFCCSHCFTRVVRNTLFPHPNNNNNRMGQKRLRKCCLSRSP